jgi:P2-related tail formation protein
MKNDDSTVTSSYLQYLPANFQTQKTIGPDAIPPPATTFEPFMSRFLLAFERILSGGVPTPHGLTISEGVERLLAWIPNFFVPLADSKAKEAPIEFLDWLAGWVALSLRGDWTEAQQRKFIQQMPQLYRCRGTFSCMQQMLDIFIETGATITEPADVPHFFTVTYQVPDPSAIPLYDRAVRAIIDQEKPAYTFYGINMLVNPMTLPIHVGVTSILGTGSVSPSSSSSQPSSMAPPLPSQSSQRSSTTAQSMTLLPTRRSSSSARE